MVALLRFLLLGIFILPACVHGQVTVTKSWSGNESIDNATFNAPTVTFTSGVDFAPGTVIQSITCSITFSKEDNSCTTPGGGDPFNDEIRFQIRGPSSLPTSNRRMINFGDFTGLLSSGEVTMTFDGTTALPANPTSGHFDSNQEFSVYVGESPFGSWRVRAIDNWPNDPLCFSAYSISITADAPLPIDYLNLSVQRVSSHVARVLWEIDHKADGLYHVVEKSTDGQSWLVVDTLAGINQSEGVAAYQYFDMNASEVESYYRIQMMGVEGDVDHSKVLFLPGIEEAEPYFNFKILGNPCRDVMSLQFSSIGLINNIQLIDSKGHIVREYDLKKQVKEHIQTFNIQHLLPGMYAVVVQSTTGKSQSKRIIIN